MALEERGVAVAVKVTFDKLGRASKGNPSEAFFSFDGVEVGRLQNDWKQVGYGMSKEWVVSDYTVEFDDDRFKPRVFVIESNPTKFAERAFLIQNQRRDFHLVYAGPFTTPAAALSAAKEWVRTVARGEGRDP